MTIDDSILALNNVPCGVHSLDLYGKIIFMNQTEMAWLGYTEEEILGKSFMEIITPYCQEKFKEKYPIFIKEGKVRDIEFELIAKDGTTVPVTINSDAGYDENGKYKCSYSFVTNTSHLKASEKKLKEQSLVTKTITDNATVALFMMDEKGFCTFMNPAAEKMTGYTFEEITQKPLHYMIHHQRPDGSYFPMEECPIDRALPQNFDVRAHEDVFIHKNGSFIPVTCAASPIFNNGKPVATVIEVRDISELKNNIEEIHQKTKSLQILNTIGKSISGQLDLQRILQDVTDATTKLSGAEFGAFFYKALNEKGETYMLYTLSGAPKEAFERLGMPRNTEVFQQTFSGNGVVRVDDIRAYSRYGKNPPHFGMPKGHLPVVSYLAVPVHSKSGEVIGGLFFGHSQAGMFTQAMEDMVVGVAAQAAIAIDNARLFEQLNKLNSEKEQLLYQAIESDRKKDEFMGIASHELKTPLTSLKAYTQLLSIQGEVTKESLQKYFHKISDGVDRLEKLVNDLLDVSRIQSGRLTLKYTKFNFVELIDRCIENITLISHTYKINRNQTGEIFIEADRERIEQVLINLLTNAVKYSPDHKEININIAQVGKSLEVRIIDKGIGIPKPLIKKIFSRFYRIEDNSQRFSGLGIGLYICYEIITQHGGEINVESQEGEGSEFIFTIPLCKI